MNKKLLLGIFGLVALVAASAILYNQLTEEYVPDDSLPDTSEEPTDEALELAPDFSMEDSLGNVVNLSDFKGTPVVLNFWASWCPPCKSEMPDFESLYQEFGEDVTFVMLNATDGSRETREKAEAFIAQEGYEFPVYFDTNMEGSATYGISSLPTTLFIDKDGYLISGVTGMISETSLRKGIALLLEDSDETNEATYSRISAQEAKTMMESESDYILLDVRAEEEFAQEHIEGAKLIPHTEIAARAEAELPDKSQVILVYCRSGRRSEVAAKELVAQGYTRVYDFGGINEWTYGTVK